MIAVMIVPRFEDEAMPKIRQLGAWWHRLAMSLLEFFVLGCIIKL